METKLFEVLDGKFKDQIESLKEVVSGGGAKSYDHYKELCGNIRGLQTAQYELADLVRKLKEYEDD
mgnify:FL=1|jgi:hypothetical protein